MRACGVTAFVECSHRLISRSNLNLHKVRFVIIAGWAYNICRIHVLPCGCTSHYMVHFLERMYQLYFNQFYNGLILVYLLSTWDISWTWSSGLRYICMGTFDRRSDCVLRILQQPKCFHKWDKTTAYLGYSINNRLSEQRPCVFRINGKRSGTTKYRIEDLAKCKHQTCRNFGILKHNLNYTEHIRWGVKPVKFYFIIFILMLNLLYLQHSYFVLKTKTVL